MSDAICIGQWYTVQDPEETQFRQREFKWRPDGQPEIRKWLIGPKLLVTLAKYERLDVLDRGRVMRTDWLYPYLVHLFSYRLKDSLYAVVYVSDDDSRALSQLGLLQQAMMLVGWMLAWCPSLNPEIGKAQAELMAAIQMCCERTGTSCPTGKHSDRCCYACEHGFEVPCSC